jgi:hypothetical protein
MSARRPIFFSLLMVTGCVFLFGAHALSVRAEQAFSAASTSLGAAIPVAQVDQAEAQELVNEVMSGPEGEKLEKAIQRARFITTIGGIFSFAGWLWFLISAFRVSIGWGFGFLFFGPLVGLFFLCMHWDDAKKPFGIALLGFLINLGGIVPIVLLFKDELPALLEQITGGAGVALTQVDEPAPPRTRTVRIPTEFPAQPEQTTLEEIVPADSATGEPVRLADSEVRVKELMPKPKIRLQQGGRVYYLFDGVEIWLYKDKVVVIRPPGVWGGPSE